VFQLLRISRNQQINQSINVAIMKAINISIRTARRMERMVGDHPTATNIILWLLGFGLVAEIFMYG
jgi:hypothetical protein